METKTAVKKATRKKSVSSKIARKKAAATVAKPAKKAKKAALQHRTGALETIGYAAGATVGKITSIADHATRAIKDAAGKVLNSRSKN